MNLGTAITLLIVGVVLFFALRSTVRRLGSSASKCDECGGGCHSSGCGCSQAESMVKRLDQNLGS